MPKTIPPPAAIPAEMSPATEEIVRRSGFERHEEAKQDEEKASEMTLSQARRVCECDMGWHQERHHRGHQLQ